MMRAYLIIDERGDFFLHPDKMLTNLDLIQQLERNLKLNADFSLTTHTEDEEYLVESFDHPLMIVSVSINETRLFERNQLAAQQTQAFQRRDKIARRLP